MYAKSQRSRLSTASTSTCACTKVTSTGIGGSASSCSTTSRMLALRHAKRRTPKRSRQLPTIASLISGSTLMFSAPVFSANSAAVRACAPSPTWITRHGPTAGSTGRRCTSAEKLSVISFAGCVALANSGHSASNDARRINRSRYSPLAGASSKRGSMPLPSTPARSKASTRPSSEQRRGPPGLVRGPSARWSPADSSPPDCQEPQSLVDDSCSCSPQLSTLRFYRALCHRIRVAADHLPVEIVTGAPGGKDHAPG